MSEQNERGRFFQRKQRPSENVDLYDETRERQPVRGKETGEAPQEPESIQVTELPGETRRYSKPGSPEPAQEAAPQEEKPENREEYGEEPEDGEEYEYEDEYEDEYGEEYSEEAGEEYAQDFDADDSIFAQIRQVISHIEEDITTARRVPLSRTLVMVDHGELLNLVGQLRLALPESVVTAEKVLAQRSELLQDAEEKSNRMKQEAESLAQNTKEEARNYDRDTRARADADSKNVMERARAEANAMLQDAQMRAQAILDAAQATQKKMVENSEITRRAQAFSLELKDNAQKEADRIYSQACMQVDKMLSGASSALARSATEMSQLRENLLGNGQVVPHG
jgi:cell division septum initiation protein DivIVA